MNLPIRKIFVRGLVAVSASCAATAYAQSWEPPDPTTEERDWVRLSSGEWIWGEIKLAPDPLPG